MTRRRAAALFVLCGMIAGHAWATDTEYIYGTSSDVAGPPYAALDLSEGDALTLQRVCTVQLAELQSCFESALAVVTRP